MTDRYEIEVDSWMKQFAAIDDREHRLPDPSVIWLKARVLQAARDVERASRPITAVQIASYAIVAACWAALLMWKWTALQAWLSGFTPSSVLLGATGAQSASLSLTFFVTLVVLASITVMVTMQSILLEE